MPHNIIACQYLGGELTINLKDAYEFSKNNRLAEGNFIEECLEDYGGGKETVEVSNVEWYGERSGVTYDTYLKALALTRGWAEIVVVWEGGDELDGLRVMEGKVTRHEVKISLVD